jgi:hypothetical protein
MRSKRRQSSQNTGRPDETSEAPSLGHLTDDLSTPKSRSFSVAVDARTSGYPKAVALSEHACM